MNATNLYLQCPYSTLNFVEALSMNYTQIDKWKKKMCEVFFRVAIELRFHLNVTHKLYLEE